ncbi:hypothetical protein FA13DRAFT_1797774 [Coprinellus micaceus]|uniref:Protein kinase domain-containing protein n=1 Tax=Coprinellus micaceus TaxID=71717 RepID=A0A4Y7SPZ5_COPMI|nr:hypothetical protein FA13DRAFT_1797774 [Coprinellus micaceus]
MSSQIALQAPLRVESENAVQSVEVATQAPLEGREERLGASIISLLTILRCSQLLLQYQATRAAVHTFIDALQQTPAVHAPNRLLEGHGQCPLLPMQAAQNHSSTNIFRCVAEGGRVLQLELPRAKSDAQDSKIERLIHCIILRFNYPDNSVLPLIGVHQEVSGDFHRTYLKSPHYQHGSIRNYLNNNRDVNRLPLITDILKSLDFLHSHQ